MTHFVADQNDLTDIANKLRGAATQLGNTASSAPPSPDAGSSSGLVSQVIADLMRTGARPWPTGSALSPKRRTTRPTPFARRAESKVDSDTDNLGSQATSIGGALNDFAGALTSIYGKMTNAVNEAHGAGLTVNAPTSVHPTHPVPLRYCKSTVDSARQQETQAHKDLEQSISKSDSILNELVTIGDGVRSRVLDYIKSTRDVSNELLDKADEETKAGAFYETFNEGNLISLTPEEQSLIDWGKQQSGKLSTEYTNKADQLQSFIGNMPKSVQNFIAANPGTLLKDGSQFLKYTKSVVGEMPYLGTVLNAVGQSYEAASGEKTWGRASADFAADTVGSAVGSALGGAAVGAVMGSEVPVVGTIIGAGVDAFLGSAAADKMVDIISNPTEFDEKAVQNFQNMNLGTNNALNYPG